MSDLVRVGYITNVNYADGTAQVVYKDRDNAVSPFMPLWSNEFDPPEIDTMVYVLHLPNGGTRGMILVPPYTEGNRPPEGIKGIWRKDFGDGSYIRYDRNTNQLDIVSDNVYMEALKIAGNLTVDGEISATTIKATGNLTVQKAISAASIKTTGNVHVGGNLTVDGSHP